MTHQNIGWETLRRMRLMENNNRWVANQLSPFMGKRVLEVGAGIANLSPLLIKKGRKLFLSDINHRYAQNLKETFNKYPAVKVIRQDISQPQAKNLKRYQLDTIVCVNVLEHIENDQKALENMAEILAPKGKLLLIVPALPLLFGNLDKHLNHFRRYTKHELINKLSQSCLKIKTIYYHNLPSAIGWFISGRLLRTQIISPTQARLADKLIPLISWVEEKRRPPFGLSLVVIAQKQ